MSGLPTRLLARLERTDAAGALRVLREEVPGRIVFTTSFGIEDQALTHLILTAGLDFELVTFDTGRLFPETCELWAATERRYGIRIAALHPDAAALDALLAEQGPEGFRDSVPARLSCCHARKVEPLGRALAGSSAWVTGLRADQSPGRAGARLAAWDDARGLVKLNPLIGWSRDDAVHFAAAHQVPVNALHARGFPSIGCAPCTRAVRPGESERAGRWWWERDAKTECGLHVGPDGRLARAGAPAEARP